MLLTYTSWDRFQRWVDVVAAHKPVAGARVLSSGCGVGGSLLAWWSAGAASVVGLEVDPALAEMAVLRTAEIDEVEAVHYAGGTTPFDDGEFDIVESLDVLEHVAEPESYVGEVARTLKRGVCLLVTPNRLWPVEQHVNVVGPPWLPIHVANRLYPALGRAVAPLADELAWRMTRVPSVREHNVSFRRLRGLAVAHGLRVQCLVPTADLAWPLPPVPRWVDRLARTRIGKFVAPTRAHAVLLWKDAEG